MLTRSGWLLLVGSVASLATGRLFGALELYVIGATALALLVVAVAWVWRPAPALTISRQISPPRVSVGGAGRVEVRVANDGLRPTAFITLVDPVEHTVGARLDLGRLPGGSHREAGYRIPTTTRGLLHIGPLVAQRTDPFGLARRQHPGPGPATVTILPTIDEVPPLLAGGGRHEPLAGAAVRTMATNGIDDLATLRAYVVGDDMRRVHWPSTARTGELQVRRDEEPWQGHLTVVLDARREALDAPDFERAVSAAAGLVHAVAEAGDRVRLLITDGTDSAMVDGRRASGGLLEALALVHQHASDEVSLPPPDPRHPEPAVLISGEAEPGPVAAELSAAGYAHVRVIRFAATGAGPADPAVIEVAPDEPFAAAWARRGSAIGQDAR